MNVLSLCSGIGGLDLGVRIACPAAQTVCWVEADGYCQRVLAARMRDGSLDCAPIHGDLTRFDGRPWRGCVDLVTAGFPCQDISNAGRREGIREGNRSGLWFEVARVVREVGPRFVFLENVSALLNRGLDIVLGDLADLGFNAEWLCVSAADVGAPHLRKRVFILAESQDPRHEWSRTARRRGSGPADGSIPLADAEGGSEGWSPGQRPASRASVGRGSGAVVALPDLRQCEQPPGLGAGPGETCGSRPHGEPAGPGDGVPLFPPGPADRAGWAAVLAGRPDLAPAVERGVRGVAVRAAARVDRLRALGNSVLSLQAAFAFRVLAQRLGQEEE